MAAATKSAKPLASFRGSLLLVGAGKMGGAMLEGWLARGLPGKAVSVIEPQPDKRLRELARRGLALNPPGRAKAAAMIVAVKPQVAAAVMETAATRAGKSTLVISIMAGPTLAFLQGALPAGAPVVR